MLWILYRKSFMKFLNKKFWLIIIIVIFSAFFIQQIFSQEEWFWIFDITFHTGINSPIISHLQETVDISWANFTGFRIKIQNTTEEEKAFKLNFWNQIHTADSENILWCDLADTSFKSNMLFDTWSFTIPAWSWIYKYIQLNFNACSSWDNLWCIAIQEGNTNQIWAFDINLSKIWFIDFNVISDVFNCNTIEVKAFQENRNIFPTSQKILPNQRTEWTLGFYSTNWNLITTWSIELWRSWTWKTNISTNLSWYYYVTFQWLSSTKALISWILINTDNKFIDFTTWDNIFWATTEDRNEDWISDDWLLYLRVWEIPPYDGEVNWDDIAKLLPSINKTSTKYWLDEYDIDADGWITIADIWIIIYNLHQRSVWNKYSDTNLLPRMLP